MKTVAIIMAGGIGERFWPMSKTNKPKQFLNLIDSNKSMIRLTIERISSIIEYKDIFVITNEKYKDIIFNQLSILPKENIIFEPLSKNTAPCIALATAIIKKKYNDANIIVLPADHAIKNIDLFVDTLELAISNITDENIITLGIVPTRIETNYGYIKLGKQLEKNNIYKVENFTEKPKYEIAKKYYESGRYIWNSGMFIWRNSYIEKCLKIFIPELYTRIQKISKKIGTKDFIKILKNEYEKITPISIDYGILEKAPNILVIPGNFGWDDVGNWLSIERLNEKDNNNNIIRGETISIKSENNIIINNQKNMLITTLGANNLIIISSENNIMVLNKENIDDIKLLIDEVKSNNKNRYL